MGSLHIKAAEWEYKKYGRRLTGQLMNSFNHEIIIEEIVRGLTNLKHTNEVSSDQVLMWVQRVKAQRVEKEVLDNIRDTIEFDSEETNRSMILGS